MVISLPFAYFCGYPPLAKTTHTQAPSSHSILTSESRSSVIAWNISIKSVLSIGRTTCVSGSPKRALYSTTFIPSGVRMSPQYKTPLKGRPSAFIALTVGRRILFMTSAAISLS